LAFILKGKHSKAKKLKHIYVFNLITCVIFVTVPTTMPIVTPLEENCHVLTAFLIVFIVLFLLCCAACVRLYVKLRRKRRNTGNKAPPFTVQRGIPVSSSYRPQLDILNFRAQRDEYMQRLAKAKHPQYQARDDFRHQSQEHLQEDAVSCDDDNFESQQEGEEEERYDHHLYYYR